MKYIKVFVILILLLLLNACVTYRQFQGKLPPNKISILQQIHLPALVVFIDHRWVGPGIKTHYELLPGKHTLKVEYMDGRFGYSINSQNPLILNFTAKAGISYKMITIVSANTTQWTPQILEEKTGAVVSKIIEGSVATNQNQKFGLLVKSGAPIVMALVGN